MLEKWKQIASFPLYEVSSLGRVVCTRYGRRVNMAFSLDRDGYHKVRLTADGRRRKLSVHGVVLTAFVSPRPTGASASHLNGIRTDNRLANLTWESHRANIARKESHGTSQRGERSAVSKLNDVQVLEIRALARRGVSMQEIANRFGVTRPNIGYIVNRATWNHVGG